MALISLSGKTWQPDNVSMPTQNVDTTVAPQWLRTGYRFLSYPARQNRQWWVIRVNYGFPEQDFAMLFIDGAAGTDVTAEADDSRTLVASIGRLPMTDSHTAVETSLMPTASARDVVGAVAQFVDYGSEVGASCDWCPFDERDPFTPAG